MKRLIPVLLALPLFACLSGGEAVDRYAPEQAQGYAALEAREQALLTQLGAAQAALEAALATPEPEDDAAAEAEAQRLAGELDATQEALARIEEAAARRQAAEVSQPLDLLVPGLSALAVGMAPLLSRRRRSKMAGGLKKLSGLELVGGLAQLLAAYAPKRLPPEGEEGAK